VIGHTQVLGSRFHLERVSTCHDVVCAVRRGTTMVAMELGTESVIERGRARCPHCVAVADYYFVELGPNLMRYEVDCARCGEVYCEEHGPVPPSFGALAPVPDWNPTPRRTPVKLVTSALLLLRKHARYP
jgi:hypothetical protein